jgi:hypothetical protein
VGLYLAVVREDDVVRSCVVGLYESIERILGLLESNTVRNKAKD